jgi:hypothetical protein
MAGMRKIVAALTVIAAFVLAAGQVASGDRSGTRAQLSGRFAVRVPAGWQQLRCLLAKPNAMDSAEAIASFTAGLTRDTCESGLPNILNFPRDSVFVFVWEDLRPSLPKLARVRNRPMRFHLATDGDVRQLCDGPSDTFIFKDAGRVFEVSAYFGPASGLALRARVAAMLASLTIASHA